MKIVLILLSLTMLSNADYLYVSVGNHCVYDVQPYQDHMGSCWIDRHDGVSYCSESVNLDVFKDGYFYDAGSCTYKNDLKITGLTQLEFDSMMAFLANLIGFTMLMMVSYISVLIAKK